MAFHYGEASPLSDECNEESNGLFIPSDVEGKCIIATTYFVYIIKNSVGKLYVGVTQNPQDRVSYHNQKRGARFTKYVPTFEIAFLEEYKTLAEARKREIQIKKWRREKKEMLIGRYKKELQTKI